MRDCRGAGAENFLGVGLEEVVGGLSTKVVSVVLGQQSDQRCRGGRASIDVHESGLASKLLALSAS